MALLLRVYFNAVLGGLGGLIGWMLFGVFADPTRMDQHGQALLGGALIGGSIGYLVVSVEALRDRALIRFCRLATYGLVLGALGGALGFWVGDHLNSLLLERYGARKFAVALGARGVGWMVLGWAVGLSEGVAARSLGKMSYGAVGGALGGLAGGSLFAALYQWAITQPAGALAPGDSAALAGAPGLVVLGACIGALSAFVQGVFQPASVRVVRGWQEGREYPLDRAFAMLGRDEGADVALFRDMRIEKQHAVIERTRHEFVLHNRAAPAQTLVNDAPVVGRCPLADGDRIQLGGVVLRFQLRAATVRKRRPPALLSQPAVVDMHR